MSHGLWCVPQIVAIILGVLMPHLVSAADLKISPLLSLAESYTDNVTLSSGSTPKESQWITQVNPGLSIRGKGRGLDLSLAYRMQSLFYLGNGDRNNVNHHLISHAKADLIRRFLFLDASATVTQQVIDPTDKISANNLAVNTNRQNVATTRVSPYIQTRLFRTIDTKIRATQERVLYENNKGLNSTANQYNMSLGSLLAGGVLSWRVGSSNQTIHYQENLINPNNLDEKNSSTSVNIGYQVGPKLQLIAIAGREYHDYQYSIVANQPEDKYWQAGGMWRPNSRTSVRLAGGRRFFGHTWNLDVSRKGKRSTMQIGYNEHLSSLRHLQSDRNIVSVPVDVAVLSNEVFIDRRSTMRWLFSAQKLTSKFFLSHSKREYQFTNAEETVNAITLIVGTKLNRQTEINFNISRRYTKRVVGNDEFSTISFAWNKKLGRHVSSNVDLLHSYRVSNVIGVANNYTENQITASLNMGW